MISFLFWNLADNEATVPALVRLAVTYTVDVFLLAECPVNTGVLVDRLNELRRGAYQAHEQIGHKVRVVSRLPAEHWEALFNNVAGDMTVWQFRTKSVPFLLLAVVHLPAKSGGVRESDQHSWAQSLAGEIVDIEEEYRSCDTVLVGDLNMNPFDPGMVSVTGFHGHMTKDLARRADRRHRGKTHRRFYNPMWGLFGDRTPGPAGTYYWDSSVPSNHHWHILDQVLLRPSLMNRLLHLQILDGDGDRTFLKNGAPSKDLFSDHLPILFQLDV